MTQNQAFYAIVFLHGEVLGVDMKSQKIQALQAQERKHIPGVLTKKEVALMLADLNGLYEQMVSPMYGCGLRMQEALNLRVKAFDYS